MRSPLQAIRTLLALPFMAVTVVLIAVALGLCWVGEQIHGGEA